jgi:alkylated DNA repair protein (DNA oxidative demethylase)
MPTAIRARAGPGRTCPRPCSIFGRPGRPGDAAGLGLINLYRGDARMGLHQDRDEADKRFPVLSISLGDTAVFRIGGTSRKDPTRR